MAEKVPKWDGTRLAILGIVGVFIISSLAFSIFVIYEQFIKKDSTADTTTTTKTEGDKLEGTILSGFTPVQTVDSLQVIDTVKGTGEEVKADSTITAHYTGALASTGVIFQSSLDTGSPFTSSLSGLITGWQQGIPGMKVGGTRRLVIPASLAYGDQAQSGIPANSNLVFDIQLISVE